MIFGFNGNTRMNKLAGALVLAIAASSAHAAIQVGGGATLPAVGYVGSTNIGTRLISSPDAGSMLGAFKTVFHPTITGAAASYCQTGSGAGKNILAGVSGTSVQNNCAPDFPSTVTVTGFGANTVGRSTLTQPNFTGSDSPLSTGDYNNYTTNRTTSQPVQFPAVAGAIAIVYSNNNLSTTLNLTTAQVCGIFNGTITTWTGLGAPVPATGSDTLKVVYRSDGSGTSFGLSNFLSQNCAGTVAQHFKVDQSFANAVSLYSLPSANWTGKSGNPGVVNAVVADPSGQDGFIGYAEAANAQAALGQIATVNNLDPVANLGDPSTHKVALAADAVVARNAITGVDANNGHATYGVITTAPNNSCINLVKPEKYAIQPSGSYPMVAVSYLLGNSNGNGSDLTDVQNLLGAPYNSSIISGTNTIGAGTGLAFLDVSATSLSQSLVTSCVVN